MNFPRVYLGFSYIHVQLIFVVLRYLKNVLSVITGILKAVMWK